MPAPSDGNLDGSPLMGYRPHSKNNSAPAALVSPVAHALPAKPTSQASAPLQPILQPSLHIGPISLPSRPLPSRPPPSFVPRALVRRPRDEPSSILLPTPMTNSAADTSLHNDNHVAASVAGPSRLREDGELLSQALAPAHRRRPSSRESSDRHRSREPSDRQRNEDADRTDDRSKRRRLDDSDREREYPREDAKDALRRLKEEKKKTASLERDLAEKTAEGKRREQRYEDRRSAYKEELSRLKVELHSLQAEQLYGPDLDDKDHDDGNLRQRPKINPTAHVAVVAAQRAARDQDLQRTRSQLEEAQRSLKAANTQIEAVEDRAAKAEARVKDLAAGRTQAEDEGSGDGVELARLRSVNDNLTKEYTACLKNLTDAQEQENNAPALRQTIITLSASKAELEQRMEDTKAEAAKASLEKDRQLEGQREESRELSLTRGNDPRALEELRADKRGILQDLERAKERAEKAENEVLELENKRKFLAMERDQAKKEVVGCHAQIGETNRRKKLENTKFFGRLNAATAESQRLTQANQALEEERDGYLQQLSTARSELKEARTTVSELDTETNGLLQGLKVKRAEEAEVLAAAQQKVETLTSAKDDLAKQLAASQTVASEVPALKQENSQLKAENSTLASQYDDLYDGRQKDLARITELESGLSANPTLTHGTSIPQNSAEPIGAEPKTVEGVEADDSEMASSTWDDGYVMLQPTPSQVQKQASSSKKRSTPSTSSGLDPLLVLKRQIAERDREIARLGTISGAATAAKIRLEDTHLQDVSAFEVVRAGYRQALEEHTSKSQRMETELVQLRDERDTYASLNKRLTLEKGSLLDKVQEMEDSLLYSEPPNEESARKVKELEAKLKEARSNGSRYRAERDGMRGGRDEANSHIKKLETELEKLREGLDMSSLKRERDVPGSDAVLYAQSQHDIEAQAAELSTQQAKIDELHAACDSLQIKADAAASLEADRNALIMSLETAWTDIADLSSKVRNLESQNNTESADRATIDSLRAELAKKQITIDASTSEITRLQSEIDSATKNYNAAVDEKRAESADEIYALSEKVENQDRELAKLRTLLPAAAQKADEYELEAGRLKAEVVRLNSIIVGMRGAAEVISAELSILKLEREGMLEGVEESEGSEEREEGEVTDAEDARPQIIDARAPQRAQKQPSQGQLEAEINWLNGTRHALIDNVTSREARIRELEREATEAKERIAELTSAAEAADKKLKLKKSASDYSKLEVDVKAARESVDAKSAEVERMAEDKKATLRDIETTSAAHARELEAALSELSTAQTLVGSLRSDVTRLTDLQSRQVAAASQQANQLGDQITDLKAKLTKSTAELEAANATNRTHERTIQARARELQQQQALVTSLESDVARVQTELGTAVANHKTEHNELLQKLVSLTGSIQEQERKWDSARGRELESTRLQAGKAETTAEEAKAKAETTAKDAQAEASMLTILNQSLAEKSAEDRKRSDGLDADVRRAHQARLRAEKAETTAKEAKEKAETTAKEAKAEAIRLTALNQHLAEKSAEDRKRADSLDAEVKRVAEELARVQALLATHERTVGTYVAEQTPLQGLNTTLNATVTRLQGEIATAGQATVERDALRTEKDTLVAKAAKLEEQIEDSERSTRLLESQLEEKQKVIEESAKEAEELKRKADDVGARNVNLTSDAEEASRQRDRLQFDMDSAKKLTGELQEELRTSRSSAANAQEQNIESHVAETSKLRADITQLETDLATARQYQTQRDAARSEVKSLVTQVRDLTELVKTREAEIKAAPQYQAQLNTARADLRSLTKHVRDLNELVQTRNGELATVHTSLQVSMARAAALLTEGIKRGQELSKSQTEARKLGTELDEAKAAGLAAAESQREEVEKLVREHSSIVDELREKIQTLSTANAKQRIVIETHMGIITEKRLLITKLETEVVEAEKAQKHAEEAQKKRQSTLDDLARLGQAVSTANATIAEQSKVLEANTSTLAGKEGKMLALSKDLAKATADLEAAQKEADRGGVVRQKLVDDSARLEKELETAKATILQHLETLKTHTPQITVGRLRQDLVRACARADAAQKQVDDLSVAKTTLSGQIAGLKEEVKSAGSSISAQKSTIDALQMELDGKQSLVDKLSTELGEEKEAAGAARDGAVKLEETISKLSADITDLRRLSEQKIAAAQGALDAKTAEIAHKQSLIDKLNTESAGLQVRIDAAHQHTLKATPIDAPQWSSIETLKRELAVAEEKSAALSRDLAALRSQMKGSGAESERLAAELSAANATVIKQKQDLDDRALKELGRGINIDTLHNQIARLRSELETAVNDTQAAVEGQRLLSDESEIEMLRISIWAEELDTARVALEEEVKDLRLRAHRRFTAVKLCSELFPGLAVVDNDEEDPEMACEPDAWMAEVVAKFKGMEAETQKARAERDTLLDAALKLEQENNMLKDNLEKVDAFLSSRFPDYPTSAPAAPPTPLTGSGGGMNQGAMACPSSHAMTISQA